MEFPPANPTNTVENYIKFNEVLENEYFSQVTPVSTIIHDLLKVVFPTIEEIKTEIEELKAKYHKELCSALIDQNDLSFKCYDCGRENEFHIYCEACFKNGSHEGHRTMYSCERGGCCDCGDSGAIEEVGFCKNHKGYAGIDASIVDKVPLNFKEGLECFISWSYIFLVREYEKNNKMKRDTEDEKVERYKHFEKMNFFHFHFYDFLYSMCKDNICMTFFFTSFILKTPTLNGEPVAFFHVCENQEKNIFENEAKACKCSFLELIFRFNECIFDNIQEDLEKFWFCLFADFNFKKKLVSVFAQMFSFLMKVEKTPDDKYTSYFSKFRILYSQFFTEQLLDIFISSGIMEKSFEKIGQMLEFLKEGEFVTIYDRFMDFYNIFFFLAERKNSLLKKVLSSDLTIQYVRNLFVYREIKYLNFEQQRHCLLIQRMAVRFFEQLLLFFSENLDLNAFLQKINEILSIFSENPDKFLGPSTKPKENTEQLCFVYESALYAIAITLNYALLKHGENVYLLEENLQIDKEFLLRVIGRNIDIILITQNFKSNYSSTNDFHTKKQIVEIMNGPQLNFIDNHLVSIQIISLLLKDSKLFSHENPVFSNTDEYLLFLKNIITNEVALLNSSPLLPLNSSSPFRWKLLSSILSNVLIAFPKIEYKTLRSYLDKNLLNKTIEIKENLLLVCDFNQEDKFFRLKKKWEEVYEPVFWFKVPDIGAKYFENLRSTSLKDPNIELLLGCQDKYSENPLILNILSLLEEPDIVKFLLNSLLANTEPSENFRYSLKILYLLLDRKNLNSLELIKLLENEIEKIFLKFNEWSGSSNFSEFRKSLEIIRKSLQNFTQNSFNLIPTFSKQMSFDKNSKREAQKKALLQQFSEKQKTFLDKNTELFVEMQGENEKSLSETTNCFICQEEKNNQTDFFCISAYFSLDSLNNYYYREWTKVSEDLKQKYQHLPEERFLIISCNHQTHNNCLLNHLKNKNKQNPDFSESQSDAKYHCFCCQYSCNISLPIISTLINSPIVKNLSFTNLAFKQEEYKNILENLDFHSEDLEKAFNCDSSFMQEIEKFANKLVIHLINSKSSLKHEFQIFDVLFHSLLFYTEEALSEGLEYFLKKRSLIARNVFLILKFFFWRSSPTESFKQYLQIFKQDLVRNINELYNIDKDNLCFLRNIDLFVGNIMWKLGVLLFYENEKALAIVINLCKIFVNKLIVIYGYLFLSLNEEIKPDLETLLKKMESFDFRIKIISFLIPFFHFIASVIATLMNFDFDLMQKRLKECIEIEEQMTFFSSFFGNLFSLDLDIIELQGKVWIEQLTSLSHESKVFISSEIIRNPCMKYSSPILDTKFLGFYTRYIRDKCFLCKDYPRRPKMDLYVCLICEEVICSSFCGVQKPAEFNVGNLSKHAAEKHCDKTFFLNLLDSKILWIHVPLLYLDLFLYNDSLGQNLTRRSFNYKDFNLNSAKLEKLRSILVRREIFQSIYYQILKYPNNLLLSDKI